MKIFRVDQFVHSESSQEKDWNYYMSYKNLYNFEELKKNLFPHILQIQINNTVNTCDVIREMLNINCSCEVPNKAAIS